MNKSRNLLRASLPAVLGSVVALFPCAFAAAQSAYLTKAKQAHILTE